MTMLVTLAAVVTAVIAGSIISFLRARKHTLAEAVALVDEVMLRVGEESKRPMTMREIAGYERKIESVSKQVDLLAPAHGVCILLALTSFALQPPEPA